jgi:hypothetical protein
VRSRLRVKISRETAVLQWNKDTTKIRFGTSSPSEYCLQPMTFE